jgi:hypothetical protein
MSVWNDCRGREDQGPASLVRANHNHNLTLDVSTISISADEVESLGTPLGLPIDRALLSLAWRVGIESFVLAWQRLLSFSRPGREGARTCIPEKGVS